MWLKILKLEDLRNLFLFVNLIHFLLNFFSWKIRIIFTDEKFWLSIGFDNLLFDKLPSQIQICVVLKNGIFWIKKFFDASRYGSKFSSNWTRNFWAWSWIDRMGQEEYIFWKRQANWTHIRIPMHFLITTSLKRVISFLWRNSEQSSKVTHAHVQVRDWIWCVFVHQTLDHEQ